MQDHRGRGEDQGAGLRRQPSPPRGDPGSLAEGRFLDANEQHHPQVCVIGAAVRRDLFGADVALGRDVKINDLWCEVIGVLAPEPGAVAAVQGVAVSSTEREIYLPFTTALRKLDRDPMKSPPAITGRFEDLARHPFLRRARRRAREVVQVRRIERRLEQAARDGDAELGDLRRLALERDAEVLAHRELQCLGELEPPRALGVERARQRGRPRQEVRWDIRHGVVAARQRGGQHDGKQRQHGPATWHRGDGTPWPAQSRLCDT